MKNKYLILSVLVSLLLSSCAIVKPPSGGPKDETPPNIVSCRPVDGTTGFRGSEIEIVFDEYVDNRSVTEHLFINPEVEYEIIPKRRKILILLKEPLIPEFTYSLTLGTGAGDLHGNKLPSAFSLVFTSGTAIDSGLITGKVFEPDGENPYVFLYRLFGDTLNILRTPPDFKVPLGSSGDFEIKALKDGKYRAVVVDDKFKDGSYDLDIDPFAAAATDIEVKEGISSPVHIRFSDSPIDTVPPYLTDISANFSNFLMINFSEGIKTRNNLRDALVLRDSVSGARINFRECGFSEGGREITAIPEENLDSGRTYSIRAINFADSAGNQIKNDSVFFRPGADKKKMLPKIISLGHGNDKKQTVPGDTIHFIFKYPVDRASLETSLSAREISGDTIDFSFGLQPEGFAKYRVVPEKEFRPGAIYDFLINTGTITGYSGEKGADTTIIKRIRFADNNDFSVVSGTIKSEKYSPENTVLILKNGNEKQIVRPNSAGFWKLEHALPGRYLIDVFIDENGNGVYDYGYPEPFRHAEPFYEEIARIQVKKGWDTEDTVLIIK